MASKLHKYLMLKYTAGVEDQTGFWVPVYNSTQLNKKYLALTYN